MSQSHKTKPDHYESQLSADASQHRAELESRVAELYESARLSESVIQKTKITRRIDQLEAQLSFHGANPKKLPFKELREHIRTPDSDPMTNKYKGKIRNRATGIRAYCIQCQGGEVVGVKQCPAVTCPLHPFRMGADPFRGWELPKAAEIEIEDDDIAEFEEGDDDD